MSDFHSDNYSDRQVFQLIRKGLQPQLFINPSLFLILQLKQKKLRYFIELSYFGKNYHGWQIQPKQISVQETVEKGLSTILRTEIKIMGAGRTDSGVHAKIMFAHFDFSEPLPGDLINHLNSFLPKDITIHKFHKMTADAHARFDAVKRTYEYRVQKWKDSFNFDFTWQVRSELDREAMNSAAEMLLGKKDFSSFAKTHTDVKTHICEVHAARWEERNNELIFRISADRFLRNMVRAIVGTLVDVGRKKISLKEFETIIEQKDRKFASGSAPAQGLYLIDVEYPKEIFLNERF